MVKQEAIWVAVDVEADGPCPGLFSMTQIGAVMLLPNGEMDTFMGNLRPISDEYIQQALDVCGHTREETMGFDDPYVVMRKFKDWLAGYRVMFISDNNGFDWQFVNYYFHKYCGTNPFGFSSTNLGSLYKGCVGSLYKNFKHLRDTKHTHNPVDDAMGNMEAFIKIKKDYFGGRK